MASKFDKVLAQDEYFLRIDEDKDYQKEVVSLKIHAARKNVNVSCEFGILVCGTKTYKIVHVVKTDKKPCKIWKPLKKTKDGLTPKAAKRIELIKEMKNKGFKIKDIAQKIGIDISSLYQFVKKYKDKLS